MKNIITTNFLIFVLLVFCLNNMNCKADNCNFGTCGECISFTSETCVWCSEDDFNGRRCQSLNKTLKAKKPWCKKESIVNPKPKMTVTQKDFNETIDGIAVQFKPQLIKIKARPGVPMRFNMSYKPAKDYPLDVYYLMDISWTMTNKMKDLMAQAKKIHKDLSSYTNNVRLGIGSFVDKPGFPYFDFNRHQGHAFRNDVSLTDNMTQFTSMIDKIKFGANYDDPEAQLDALMQAMKCEDEIGWRKGARRIIVLCTDATYHSAGDGKIVGAIKPHDMKCHLENNLYTMGLTFDYPSVSQINKVATEGNFKIIFAIAKNTETNKTAEVDYMALSRQILGANYAKLEGGDSVINIIKEAYKESARTVRLNFDAPHFIQLTVDQDCKSKPTRNCESTHTQQTVTIPSNLTINSCPPDGNLKHEIKVNCHGVQEKLTIELEIDCKCDCEKENTVIKSSKCKNAGFLQCGICKCDPGSYGVDCRCNGTSTDQKDFEKCKFNDQDTKFCSGRGKCRCGKCEQCQEGFSGDFCQFDDNSCAKPNNKLCFGKGICRKGECECDADWTGTDCSCPNHNLDCFAPYSKEVCSGNGVCRCGVCICNALEGKNETYLGSFCDTCEECAEKRCKELEDYAFCNYQHMDNKIFCDNEKNETTKEIEVSFVNKTEINGPEFYMAKWCQKKFENGSFVVFKYQYQNNILKIVIQKELELPPKANIWVAAGSAIGLVLLIGILTVIVWKILVDIHDKSEYKKFAKEAEAAGYDVSVNPLYSPPANMFSNPVYESN